MLVLFETAAGYAIFKLLDEKILKKPDDIFKNFQTVEAANKMVKLVNFVKFEDTTQALAAATALVEGKMSSDLKKMLKKVCKETQEELLVADAKLGNCIKESLSIPCLANTPVQELMRGMRSQINGLISGLPEKEMAAFALGLAHSLSRYKLKFSPDKVDTMIVQAISLLDDIDKELNNYNMRCREWYGWHFPELGKIITDHTAYAKVILNVGHRTNALKADLSKVLPEELEAEVKEAAEISMGSEVSDEDILNIQHLCEQILDMQDYRAQLYDYLKNRMYAVAPNLTVLVGEIIGARLISHAGSLLNLAKHPASTIQILGAEKALFRALKTKHDTPKYGLIYHAHLVSQSNQKLKGKVSRMLAAKAALAVRVDALGESTDAELGADHKANLEARLKMLETGQYHKLAGRGKKKADMDKYTNKSEIRVYNSAADSTLPVSTEQQPSSLKKKKSKKSLSEVKEEAPDAVEPAPEASSGKKKKKRKIEEISSTPADSSSADTTAAPESEDISKPKKKKKKSLVAEQVEVKNEDAAESTSPPAKKKKKKSLAPAEEVEVKEEPAEAPASTKKKKKKALAAAAEVEEADEATTSAPSEKKKKKKKVKQEAEDN